MKRIHPTRPAYRIRSEAGERKLCRAAVSSMAFMACLAIPTSTGAQSSPCGAAPCAHDTQGNLIVMGANAAIGGLTAGVRQWIDGGSLVDGFWRGAIGGVGTYAGKFVATRDYPAAGVAGRAIAGIGASVTRNASEGVGSFSRLVLPVGTFRLTWLQESRDLHVSIDAVASAALVGTYFSGIGAELDVRRTLATGAPVLKATEWESNWGWYGRHINGTIILGDSPDFGFLSPMWDKALAHERVHVLQYDQAHILWSEPFEDRLMEGLGAPSGLVRALDPSIHGLVFYGLSLLAPGINGPLEAEAHILSGTKSNESDGVWQLHGSLAELGM